MNRFTAVFGAWVALFFSLDGLGMLFLVGRHIVPGRDWEVGAGVDPFLWRMAAGMLLVGGVFLGFFLGMPDSDVSMLERSRVRRRKAMLRKAQEPKGEARAKPKKKPKAEVEPAKETAPVVAAKVEPAPALKSKQVWAGGGEQIHVLVLDPGAEAFEAIAAFARQKRLKAASITAIGAFERATVGWFDARKKRYEPIEVDEQCEVLSLIGDVATGDDGKPSLHLHAVLGLRDGSTRGGHLLKATVRPTLEVVVTETPAHLRRRMRPDIGAALIDLDR